ncbi:MAG: tetratricopeptide repeat protein [Blastocatellia bacterium]
MNKHLRFVFALAFALAITPSASSVIHAYSLTAQPMVSALVAQGGRNAIYGTVFNEAKRPQADVYVELLDQLDSTMGQTKTDAAGRFSFSGLSDGRFHIRVRPYGTDYEEQMTEVVLASVSSRAGSGSDTQHIDIQLKVNQRFYTGPFAMAPATVFAQDVPDAAKKLFEEGVRALREKKEQEGLNNLKQALEVFPNYYAALDRLGAEYAMRGQNNQAFLQAGLVLLTKAASLNPNGFSSAFGLGWTQYQLGMNNEAVENLRRSTTLYGKSADAYLWLGRALRRTSQADQAEAAFKRARDLSSGKYSEVHRQLAGLYMDQKRYREAADALEQVLKTEPKAADAEKIKTIITQLREKQQPTK